MTSRSRARTPARGNAEAEKNDTDTNDENGAALAVPPYFGTTMVAAPGAEEAAGFEDDREFDTGYGTYALYTHPKGGISWLQADRFSRRRYQNKGFGFIAYVGAPGDTGATAQDTFIGPRARQITEAEVGQEEGRIRQKLRDHGVTDPAQVEALVAKATARLHAREVPQNQTLPGELVAQGYTAGVPGTDVTMPPFDPDAPRREVALPGGYVMRVPEPLEPGQATGENGNGEPIRPQPALPTGSSPQPTTPVAPNPSSPTP